MTVGGNRLFAFDLFSTNVTAQQRELLRHRPATASRPASRFFLANDGRYTAFYKTSTTNWRKISLGRNQTRRRHGLVKVDVPTSSFTGWYPDPSVYAYTIDGFCAPGGAGFYGSTAAGHPLVQELAQRQPPGDAASTRSARRWMPRRSTATWTWAPCPA